MNRKKVMRGTLLAAVCLAGMLYFNGFTSLAYWVVVSGDGTNLRASAGTDGSVVSTANKGDRLDVSGEETGSDGKTWYQVSVNNQTCYIRSDLVTKEAEGSEDDTSVTSMTSQSATVIQNDVNVRESASGSADQVATVNEGAAVTVTGTSTDSSGNTWYQVNFIDNGSSVTGFIQEGDIELGEIVGESEDDAALAEMYGGLQSEEEANSEDYKAVYAADEDGVEHWYLYDYTSGKRYKIEQLLQVDELSNSNAATLEKSANKLKIGIIILAVLLVVAVVFAVFFGLKWHELSEDEDDEDEDDDDDDEDDDVRRASSIRRRRREEDVPVRRTRPDTQESGGRSVRTGEQRRPVSGTQRRPASGTAQRTGGTAGTQRTGGTAGTQGAQRSSGAAGARSVQRTAGAAGSQNVQRTAGTVSGQNTQRRTVQRSEAGASGTGRSSGEEAPRRSAQSGQAAGRSQTTENKSSSARSNVEWKSKNFLAGDEDEPDFSFIDMDNE